MVNMFKIFASSVSSCSTLLFSIFSLIVFCFFSVICYTVILVLLDRVTPGEQFYTDLSFPV